MIKVLATILIGVAAYMYSPQQATVTKVDIPTVTAPATVIDKAAVIKSIKSQGILATLEIKSSKEYMYDDSYKSIASSLTQRKFTLTFDSKTYLGIDTSKITIETDGKQLTVFLPAPQLLSSENANIQFTNQVGWLRNNLSDIDKLYLLYKASESVKSEAMTNDNKEKATAQAKQVLSGLLKQLPNIESILFV